MLTAFRGLVAEVEGNAGELFARIGSLVTDLSRGGNRTTKFRDGRGTAGPWIGEGEKRPGADEAVVPPVPGRPGGSRRSPRPTTWAASCDGWRCPGPWGPMPSYR